MSILVIKNWERYQHYKDRSAPWVKLHRDMMTSESWVCGNDLSRVVQIASMMLAPRYTNQIPARFDLLKKVMSLDCSEQEFNEAVDHLIATDFFELQGVTNTEKPPLQNASSALATCTSEERERENRGEKNILSAAPTTRKVVSRESDPDWWLDFKLAYPERSGDQGWRKAQRAANARISEGHTTAELIAGAKRYAVFCDASAKTGTEFVKQACTFLGPDKHFLLPWHSPPETRTLSAGEQVMQAYREKANGRVVAEQFGTGSEDLEESSGFLRPALSSGFR